MACSQAGDVANAAWCIMQNIKNVTKKVLTEVTGNAIIYKSPKCGGRQNLEN
jgi:hypothetical protein